MYRRARHILGSDEEARDAMQEVFLRVATSKESFRGEAPILRWVYRITTNLCLNRLRKRKSHPVVVDPEAVRRLVSDAGSLEDRQAVLQILEGVDELTQRIALHYFMDGMKMEEVAEVVGYSRKTVGKKLAGLRAHAARLVGDAP